MMMPNVHQNYNSLIYSIKGLCANEPLTTEMEDYVKKSTNVKGNNASKSTRCCSYNLLQLW
jgi:hypothetical protein